MTKEAEKKPAKEGAASPPQKASGGRSGAAMVATLAFVIALASAYFSWETSKVMQRTNKNTLANVTELVSLTHKQNAALKQTATESQDAINAKIETIAQGLRLINRQTHQQKDWVLAQVLQELVTAQLHLRFTRQVQSSILLLETADKQLAELGDPRVLTLRQAIQTDLASLRAIPEVDSAKILTTLTTLEDQVPTLSLSRMKMSEPNQEDLSQKSKVKSQSWWQKPIDTSWHQLQKIVIVRRHDKAIKPLITEQEQQIIVQNIQLLLQQARLGMVKADNTIYRVSLEHALSWIKKFFEIKDPKTDSVVTTLEKLQQINIAPELPDISRTIVQAKELLDKKAVRAGA